MNFVEQYVSPMVYDQLKGMKVGYAELLPILEDAFRRNYVDGWNSGERSVTYRTEWHPMSCDPTSVVKAEDRDGRKINVVIDTENGYVCGVYDTILREFNLKGRAWKLIDRPELKKILAREYLWQESIRNSETT